MMILEHTYSKNKFVKFLQKIKVFPRSFLYEVDEAFGIIKVKSKNKLSKEELDDILIYIVHKHNEEGDGELYLEERKEIINFNYKKREQWQK